MDSAVKCNIDGDAELLVFVRVKVHYSTKY